MVDKRDIDSRLLLTLPVNTTTMNRQRTQSNSTFDVWLEIATEIYNETMLGELDEPQAQFAYDNGLTPEQYVEEILENQ